MMKSLVLVSIFGLSMATQAAEVSVPPKAITIAATILKSPTGPVYSVVGDLQCVSVSTDVPPLLTSRNCQVVIDEKAVIFDEVDTITEADINELVEALMVIQPATGPVYNYKSKFMIAAIETDWAPSALVVTVTVADPATDETATPAPEATTEPTAEPTPEPTPTPTPQEEQTVPATDPATAPTPVPTAQ